MESNVGAEIVARLQENLVGRRVDYAYVDEDEFGRYIGLVFTDGETEYHLTVQEDGAIQLASGPEDGDTLEEVMSFNLHEVEEPFSADGVED